MKTFVWNQTFVTGLEKVDEQHHFLVDLINRFGESLVESKSMDDAALLSVFGQLADYAKYHFATEESLMLESAVALEHQKLHIRSHQNFISQLASMWNVRATMSNPAEVLHGFLCAWLAFHVLGEDQNMGRQIALIGAGKTADEAFRLAQRPMDNSTAGLLAALQNLYDVLTEQNQNLISMNERLDMRVKELRCLHAVVALIANGDKSVPDVLSEAIHLLPGGWLHPEIACARIVFQSREYATENFEQTPWMMHADIFVGGVLSGVLEVGYLMEKSHEGESPFLNEEKILINTLASQFGAMAERKHDDWRTKNLLDLIELADVLSEKELLQKGLDTLQALTHSQVGFLHFVDESQNEIELTTWTTDTLSAYCKADFRQHYPVSEAGVWANSIRQRRAVVVNDYANAEGKKGLPQGHAPLHRFVSVPVFDGGLVRMVVGMGNAEYDYGERDVETISLFANDMYRVVTRKRAEENLRQYVIRLEKSVLNTVSAVSLMMDLRDPYTAGHMRRVGDISAMIASEMGLAVDVQSGLRVAGAVHDVGKVAVPAEILGKPRRLSAIEYEIVKAHAQEGYEVLKSVDFPWPVAEVARQHHERMDGSGYPRGLKGDEILLEARIIAVADVLEAVASHRPYRPGAGIDKALSEIEQGRGRLYDANVVEACLRLFREKGYSIPA